MVPEKGPYLPHRVPTKSKDVTADKSLSEIEKSLGQLHLVLHLLIMRRWALVLDMAVDFSSRTTNVKRLTLVEAFAEVDVVLVNFGT